MSDPSGCRRENRDSCRVPPGPAPPSSRPPFASLACLRGTRVRLRLFWFLFFFFFLSFFLFFPPFPPQKNFWDDAGLEGAKYSRAGPISRARGGGGGDEGEEAEEEKEEMRGRRRREGGRPQAPAGRTTRGGPSWDRCGRCCLVPFCPGRRVVKFFSDLSFCLSFLLSFLSFCLSLCLLYVFFSHFFLFASPFSAPCALPSPPPPAVPRQGSVQQCAGAQGCSGLGVYFSYG